MRTHFLGEHIVVWILILILVSIILLMYYFAYISGGLFGACWDVSGNPSDPVYQECLRNLR